MHRPRNFQLRRYRKNVHNVSEICSDDTITTNAAEGFNAALAMSLPRNCTIWTLIQQLRTEENTNMRKLRDAALGSQNSSTTANTSRNMKRIERRKNLKSLVQNYASLSTKDYMALLVGFFNNN